ncbi:hypothetical protein [Streptosporangium sp. NPDC051022]|uniref:hypothetical protein n=1 Tax=Streptosporangium sp. NPDC051022 TaxID=3155752 RepID=UPI0034439186
MPGRDLAAFLTSRLGEIRRALDEEAWTRTRDLLRRIATETGDEATAAWFELLSLLRLSLPRGHEIRRVILLETAGYRGASVADDLSVTLERLREMLPDLAELDLDEGMPPERRAEADLGEETSQEPRAETGLDEEILRVREALLATPCLTPGELLAAGGAPDRPGLLRLRRADGGVRLPSFQFGPGGVPLPAVLTVNRILGAATDPWGAADWWLRGNALLDEIPARLVADQGDLVAEAALALREEY